MKKGPIGLVILSSLLAWTACTEPTSQQATEAVAELPDGNKAAILNVEGQLFSIPSPIQTAMFIQKNGSGYNSSLLIPAGKARSQSTATDKAMVLGMLGADLGYISIFADQDKALPYMASIQMLSEDLGLGGAFNEEIVSRFSDNIGVTDSMLVLLSDLYESGDAYLKKEKRTDVAALVLLGGWVEGLHFSCQEAINGSEAMRKRVAEQKSALDRLVKMLGPHASDSPSIDKTMRQLNDLRTQFAKVNSTYTYRKPETITAEQTTVLKGKVIHQLTDDTLKEIATQVSSLRNQLIG